MPIKECTLPNGKSGFKWGDSGKCYKDKKDAVKQGIAIEGPKKFQKIMKSGGKELNKIAAAVISEDRDLLIYFHFENEQSVDKVNNKA